MTEHYTKQEAVELARECGFDIGSGITERVHVCTTGKVHDLINTAVTRKLAEKELEVVKLREALGEVSALIDESGGVYGLHLNGDLAPWGELLQGGRFEWIGLLHEALSTPSSTKALDEYVAGIREAVAQEIWIAAMDKCKKDRTNPADRNDLFFGCGVVRVGMKEPLDEYVARKMNWRH